MHRNVELYLYGSRPDDDQMVSHDALDSCYIITAYVTHYDQ